MKKQFFTPLLCLTCIFCAFTLGFFMGRNQNHEVIHLDMVARVPLHNIPPASVTIPEETQEEVKFPVDINSATSETLSALPGIGPTLAERILAYRNRNGKFQRPEELLNVDGIGPGKLEAILDYVITGG